MKKLILLLFLIPNLVMGETSKNNELPAEDKIYQRLSPHEKTRGLTIKKTTLPSCPEDKKQDLPTYRDNCQGKLTLPDGLTYEGEWGAGKFHGQGKLTLSDGYTYEGEWKDGIPDGKGTIINPNGETYFGEFKDGKQQGQGTYTFANGSKYVGEYKDDKRHGQGTLMLASGSKYVGEWKDGKYHGQGNFTYANGDKYFGEWKDDKRHGQGNFTYANGDKYVGEWKDGKQHGQGTLMLANGNKYVGEFKDGKQQGQGNYTFANGSKYVGEFKDNLPNGQGTMMLASGDKYVGEHKDGTYHGQGNYTFVSGDKYVGEWKDGKYHGQGNFTYANGDKYVGEWKDDKRHGQGNFTYANGDKYVGEWKDGKLLTNDQSKEEDAWRPSFLSTIPDTQKYNNLNIYCIKDAIKEGKINYDQCVENNKAKEITHRVVANLDSSKNVGSYIINGDETWYADLADYLPGRSKNTGIYIYETIINTGGTGNFSSISVLELHDNNILEHHGDIKGGDRCNDGSLEYISSDAQGTTYASAATPFRLLNYKDTTDWRRVSLAYLIVKEGQKGLSYFDFIKSKNLPSFFHNIEPYEDIDNSAIGCVGNVVRSFEFDKNQQKAIGLIISKNYLKGEKSDGSCLDRWIAEHQFIQYSSFQEYGDSIYLESKDWDKALLSFQGYCPNKVAKKEDAAPAPKLDAKALAWRDKNQWFGTECATKNCNNEEMTNAALAIHDMLIDEGLSPLLDEYYCRIDKAMIEQFPEYFTKNKSSSNLTCGSDIKTKDEKGTSQEAIESYKVKINKTISKQMQYPRLAQMRGWEGEVILNLKIDGQGTLRESSIKQSSGFKILDEEAIAMVKRASPFRKSLKELESIIFNIDVPITFTLTN